MRKLIAALSVLVALAGGYVLAQDATFAVPVARSSEAKYVVRDFSCSFASQTASINLAVQDAGSTDIRLVTFTVPDAAHPSGTFVAFLSAIGTTRATETGGGNRRGAFRLLGFLSDNGYISGTLNP